MFPMWPGTLELRFHDNQCEGIYMIYVAYMLTRDTHDTDTDAKEYLYILYNVDTYAMHTRHDRYEIIWRWPTLRDIRTRVNRRLHQRIDDVHQCPRFGSTDNAQNVTTRIRN